MARYPDLLQVQAAGDGGPRSMTQMVIIHATDNTATAEQEGSYATWRPDQVSAHFYVDSDSTVQALDTTHVAYGARATGNSRSVQFELCGLNNQLSDATMRQAAPIVARVCREFNLPIRKITPAQLQAGTTGICGHLDVSLAWGESTHTDPGTLFPWSTFISYVLIAESIMGLTPQEFDLIVRGNITPDNALFYWLRRIAEGRNPLNGQLAGIGLPQISAQISQLSAICSAADARDRAVQAAFEAITASGGTIDTDAVLAAINQVRTDLNNELADLRNRAETAEQEREELRSRISTALEPATN